MRKERLDPFTFLEVCPIYQHCRNCQKFVIIAEIFIQRTSHLRLIAQNQTSNQDSELDRATSIYVLAV